MTAVDGRAAVRLRAAAESAPGKRVLVDVADLLAVLVRPVEAAHDLDALTGQAPPALPYRQPAEPAPPRGSRFVTLAPSQADAERLARAAWETAEDGRRAEHGPFESADPFLVAGTVAAARRAIAFLLAEAAER